MVGCLYRGLSILKNNLITFKDVEKSELDEWWEDIGDALDHRYYSEGSSLVHCDELEDLENSDLDSLSDCEDFYFYVNGSGATYGEEFDTWLVRNKELGETLLRGIIDSFIFGLGALPYVPTSEVEFILKVKEGKISVFKDNLPEEYSKSYKEVPCNYDKDCTLHFFKDFRGYWNVKVSYDSLLLTTPEEVLDFIEGATFETSVRYGAPVISKNGVTVKVKIITDGYKPYGMTEHILREIYGTSLYDMEADFSNDLFKGLDRQTLTTRLTRSAVLWDSNSKKNAELGIVYSIKDLSYNQRNNELRVVVNVSIEYPTSETLGYLYIEHHKPVDFNSEVVNLGVRGSIFAHLDYFGYSCIGALQGFYFPKKFSDGKSIEVSDHIGWQLTKGSWSGVNAKSNYKEILAEIAENHLEPLKFEDKFEYYDYKKRTGWAHELN